MTVVVTALAVVLLLVVVLVAGLLRSHAEILRSLSELGVDPNREPGAPTLRSRSTAVASERPASDITGVSPGGDAVRVAVNGVPHPTLLAFLTSGCTTCVQFWNAFAGPEEDLRPPADARVIVVTKGEEAESPGRLRKFTTNGIPVVMSSAAWADYDVPVAPYFAYVDGASGRVVGEGAAMGWQQLVGMLEQALADAGIDVSRRRRSGRGGRERSERIDQDLRSAGIGPGHPSLHPEKITDLSAPESSDEG